MKDNIDQQLIKAIENIRKFNSVYTNLGLEMFEACGGKMYHIDLFVNATLNRSEHLVSAFCDLIEKKNFLVAAPILRMQLDNLFRLRSVWLVNDPHSYVLKVLQGVPIKKLKDKSGNKMTDRFLVDSLCEERPELKNIYEETCGYVHLSDKHLYSMIDVCQEGGEMTFHAAESSNNIPIEVYLDICLAFFNISGVIISYVKGWIISKDGKVQD